MRIPKVIDIYGTKYTTVYKWNLTDEGFKCDGVCDAKNKEILIDRLCPQEDKPYVYLHEVFHAILSETGIGTTTLGQNEDVEEMVVENLSKWVLDHFSLRKKKKK